MHDDDLTRLSHEELNERIERADAANRRRVELNARIERPDAANRRRARWDRERHRAMRPDPIYRPIVEVLEQHLAAQAQAAR
jgi:hypothetical protein